MASSAGKTLQREIDEGLTPTVDKYRLSKICKGAGTFIEQEITTINAYTMFLDATTILTENLVPVQNRIAFVTPSFYKCLKLDKNYTGSADKVNDLATTGYQHGRRCGKFYLGISALFCSRKRSSDRF